MSMAPILVVNPVCNAAVTERISAALQPLRLAQGPAVECLTMETGPMQVKSQCDVDLLVPHLLDWVRTHGPRAGAIVIACFSDPGLHSVREIVACPVLGIAESGVLAALSRGQRFGVLSMASATLQRHRRHFGAMGVLDRLAGDRAVNLHVSEMADTARTLKRMIEVGERLRDDDGADVLLMGCAGMAACRAPLEQALGLPVVEPTQAAAAVALGQLLLAH